MSLPTIAVLLVLAQAQVLPPEPQVDGRGAGPAQAPAVVVVPPEPSVGTAQRPAVVVVAETTEQEVQAQRDRDQQERTKNYSLALSVVGTFLTLALLAVAFVQWRTHEASLAASKAIERAYVSMSHLRPGLEVTTEAIPGEDDAWVHEAVVRIKVENRGNTPAEVTCTGLDLKLTDAPYEAVPTYSASGQLPGRAVLLKDGSFTLSALHRIQTTGASFKDAMSQMSKEGVRLYVIGFVDYIDKFGQRHRSGYARVYEPGLDSRKNPEYQRHMPARPTSSRIERVLSEGTPRFDVELYADRNNLAFLTSPGYNYDRERKPGEGHDWSESPSGAGA